MTSVSDQTCDCPVCAYGRRIAELIERTLLDEDRALVRDVYNRLVNAEDDRDYWQMRCREPRVSREERKP